MNWLLPSVCSEIPNHVKRLQKQVEQQNKKLQDLQKVR
jgi:hypothetical protein